MLTLKIKNFCKLIIANVLLLLAVIIVIETFGQVYSYLHPGFKVLAVVPEKVLGWKYVPNFEMPYTGTYWYAREFSTTVKINSLGFRDFERKPQKGPNIIRIALLGDSMVAARQVNFDKTAGQLLEKRLNDELGLKTRKKYEVLNLGVGAFGLGQQFLTYLNYARKFQPDYVITYIFDYSIWRTIGRFKCKYTKVFGKKCLSIRPNFFWLEKDIAKVSRIMDLKFFYRVINIFNNTLLKNAPPPSVESYKKIIKTQSQKITNKSVNRMLEEIGEYKIWMGIPKYEKYVEYQKEVLRKEFFGKRINAKERKIFLLDLLKRTFKDLNKVKTKMELERDVLIQNYVNCDGCPPISTNEVIEKYDPRKKFLSFNLILLVNLKVLEQLNNFVKRDNAKMIISDSSLNQHKRGLLPATILSKMLKAYSEINHVGYIPLGEKLNEANENGNPGRWKYDGHLNEMGNQVFADSMFDYLEPKLN